MIDLFEKPVRSRRVRKGIYAHGYKNGVINIEGQQYSGVTMREAIADFKAQYPAK